MKIGFIGLGTMGLPMARNLIRSGYNLRVYNRTSHKIDMLAAEGAERATSFADAALDRDAVITMLTDSPVVKEAILGQNGVLEGCKAGSIIIDMSTISPAVTRAIAERCAEKGVYFLDAPVTGGEKGAIEATLSILVGGDEIALEKVRPVLESLGSKITYMGPSGSGQAAKLCNQVICGLNIVAVAEGLSLAKASGLDAGKLLDAISGGAASSWMLTNLGPKMLANDWNPGFKISLQSKDLRLALESADTSNISLIGTKLAHRMFEFAKENGYGEEGTQALIKIIGRLLDE